MASQNQVRSPIHLKDYVASTLVRYYRKVRVRVLNATRRDQKFTKGLYLAHREPATLVTSPHVGQGQNQESTPKLHDVIAAA
jgi:hypothetical protein